MGEEQHASVDTAHSDGRVDVELPDVVLYCLTRYAVKYGPYRMKISDAEAVFAELETELETELGIRIKVSNRTGVVESRQVKRAFQDLVPYIIPMIGSNFLLHETVCAVASKNVQDRFDNEQGAAVDDFYEASGVGSMIDEYATRT